MNKALILVDIQNDFLPGGALAVPHGDEIIPIANKVQAQFNLIVATQDWHPRDHGSFASQHPGHLPGDIVTLAGIEQILWPDHCIQNTEGAALAAALETQRITKIFFKGTDPLVDSYSTFFDNRHRRDIGLGDYLKQQQVTTVYLLGLATDYCVKYSVLDACHLGFTTYVIEDGCRGINLKLDDVAAAFTEMKQAGAIVIRSDEL